MNMPPTEEESSQGKKPRASKPKVKTGCITCKARRVKCDETKPECLRCSNFGRKCGGYPSKEDEPAPKKPTHLGPRRILSKAIQTAPSPSRSPSPSPMQFAAPVAPVHRPSIPQGIIFQDEREYQYFCHFRDDTAIKFSGGFEPTLWNVLVLQACDNASIRQLTTATAALSLAMEASQAAVMRDFEKESHHQYALQQYGEALKGIREMVASGQDSMRIALISALLIFCFESLHGDLGRGIFHIQSAIELIVKRIAEAPRLFYFPRTTALGIRGSSAIDDDLLTAFMRLDRPSMAVMRRKEEPPLESNRIFTLLFSHEHLEIPRGFATIAEARTYLEDIKWRILSTRKPMGFVGLFHGASQDSSCPDFRCLPHHIKEWYEFSTAASKSSEFSQELGYWHEAFSALLMHAMSPPGDFIFVPAVTLHIQAIGTDLLGGAYFSADPSPPEQEATSSRSGSSSQFPTVNAILSLSCRLVQHPKFSKGFVFDAGIIPVLVMIMMMCPELDSRWKAVELLHSMSPRREGIWDSKMAAEEGQKLLEQEAMRLDIIDPNLRGMA